MKTGWKLITVATLLVCATGAGSVQTASAAPPPVLLGTTGACNNVVTGGPCTQTSTLVQLDVKTGAVIRVIGPVGFTVNGLAWDRRTKRLYASTAIGDVAFHGLITIDPATGAGTPVDPAVHNFGLDGADSPIHAITVDSKGRMVAWYSERPAPGVTDTFVRIDPATGVATEFPSTGIVASQNGLSFDEDNRLWNIDTTRRVVLGGPLTQVAYRLDPATGKPLATVAMSPPITAALGDFNPDNDRYYGLNFTPFDPAVPTFVEIVNVKTGVVSTLGRTIDNLHTLAFVKG